MNHPKLNIPHFPSRRKSDESGEWIFDEFRRKWVRMTPEEWVRQQMLMYLNRVLAYPATSIAVEKTLRYNGMNRRPDAVISGANGRILMVIECKKPDVNIDEKTFLQASTYSSVLGNAYVLITNGITHFIFKSHPGSGQLQFLKGIPEYTDL